MFYLFMVIIFLIGFILWLSTAFDISYDRYDRHIWGLVIMGASVVMAIGHLI